MAKRVKRIDGEYKGKKESIDFEKDFPPEYFDEKSNDIERIDYCAITEMPCTGTRCREENKKRGISCPAIMDRKWLKKKKKHR